MLIIRPCPASMGVWPLGTSSRLPAGSRPVAVTQRLSMPAAFVDSVADLHLTPSNNCSLESAAVPIAGITTDADGDTRNPVSPDIGAMSSTGSVLRLSP